MKSDRTLNDFTPRTLQKSSALQRSNSSFRFRENLGTLRNRASISDEVTVDEANTYEFRLRQRTSLKVSLENQEALGLFDLFGTKKRVQATLLDSSGQQLRRTDRIRPEENDDFRIRLNAGTYSIRVTGRSENELEYRLRLQTNRSNDFDDD